MPLEEKTREFTFGYVDDFNIPQGATVTVNRREDDTTGEVIEAVNIFLTLHPKVSGFYIKIKERQLS